MTDVVASSSVAGRRRPPPPAESSLDLAAELGPAIRDRFPALQRRVHGRRLTYLDTAATSLKPTAVIDALADHYRFHDGSAHRGLHLLADEATEAYELARAEVARRLGTGAPESVVFTRSATASLNLIARGMEHRLQRGDEVLLTEMEHHANLVPWIQLAERAGVVLRHVPVTDDGELDLARARRLVSQRTRIVSLTHVSNVLGTINPVEELAALGRAVGATVVVDAAQSVGHLPVSLDSLDADLLVASAHKCYGPAGLGLLVGRPAVLAELEPFEAGGQMIRQVFLDRATFAELPLRLEAGTPNAAAAAAFRPALDMLDEIGLDRIHRHEQQLAGYAWQRLRELGGLRLLGPADPSRRSSLVSFSDPEVHPHDMATLLDQQGVAVRAGHHCAQPLHRRLGLLATTRASFGLHSGCEDVDRLVDAIAQARKVLR